MDGVISTSALPVSQVLASLYFARIGIVLVVVVIPITIWILLPSILFSEVCYDQL